MGMGHRQIWGGTPICGIQKQLGGSVFCFNPDEEAHGLYSWDSTDSLRILFRTCLSGPQRLLRLGGGCGKCAAQRPAGDREEPRKDILGISGLINTLGPQTNIGNFSHVESITFSPPDRKGLLDFMLDDASTPRPHPVSRQSSSPVDRAEYPARAAKSRRVSRQSGSPVDLLLNLLEETSPRTLPH